MKTRGPEQQSREVVSMKRGNPDVRASQKRELGECGSEVLSRLTGRSEWVMCSLWDQVQRSCLAIQEMTDYRVLSDHGAAFWAMK